MKPEVLDMSLIKREGRQYVSRFVSDPSLFRQIMMGLAAGVVIGATILLFWMCWINNA